MTPLDIASLLKEYGMTGALAIAAGVIVYLFKRWDGCSNARLEDAKVMTKAVTEQTSANLELVEVVKGMRENQLNLTALLTEVARSSVSNDDRMRDKFDAVDKKNDETIRRLEDATRAARVNA